MNVITKVVYLEHVVRVSDEIAGGVDAEQVKGYRLLLHPRLPLHQSENHKNSAEDTESRLKHVSL